jgi:hypothetical protein
LAGDDLRRPEGSRIAQRVLHLVSGRLAIG